MKTPANSPKSVLTSNVFGLAAWVAGLFVLAALAVTTLLMWKTSDHLVSQVVASLEHEAGAVAQDYASQGLAHVVDSVARKAQVPGPGLYYVEDRSGRRLAGNLAAKPKTLQEQKKGGVFRYQKAARVGEGSERSGVALRVGLGSEAVAYIGRDIADTEAFSAWLRWFLVATFVALTLAAIAAGFAVSRSILQRISAINTTAQSIMSGDLSKRIAVSGHHDELDDLSRNLNHMLDRIGQLMLGLREVSDNIAHDLKTPLNRLRNRAEGALRDPRGGDAYREGLERTIEEADGLIKTFNALLLIARLEAGTIEETATTFDVADILDDVSELYQPVAEESGLSIKTTASGPVKIHANKQLIVQAVANLIDNAIKYGQKTVAAGNRASPDEVTVDVRPRNGSVEIRVGDHGPGISPADRKRVLNRFVRLEQSRTKPGTGLGLSLVAGVARMHGGTVELDDNKPGLCVALVLPLRSAELSDGNVVPATADVRVSKAGLRVG